LSKQEVTTEPLKKKEARALRGKKREAEAELNETRKGWRRQPASQRSEQLKSRTRQEANAQRKKAEAEAKADYKKETTN
jgi:hypothetical protein